MFRKSLCVELEYSIIIIHSLAQLPLIITIASVFLSVGLSVNYNMASI